MTDYQRQAEDFLKATGATIAFQYVGHTSRMDGAKVPTAQFRVTISREGRKPWAFDFSDSINDSYQWAEDAGRVLKWGPYPQRISGKVETVSRRTPDDAMRDAAVKGSAMWANYHVRRHTPTPTAYDVLSCIEKDDPGSHADFCANYGIDEDSIKGRDTFLACIDAWQNVRRLFSEEELDRLREIQ